MVLHNKEINKRVKTNHIAILLLIKRDMQTTTEKPIKKRDQRILVNDDNINENVIQTNKDESDEQEENNKMDPATKNEILDAMATKPNDTAEPQETEININNSTNTIDYTVNQQIHKLNDKVKQTIPQELKDKERNEWTTEIRQDPVISSTILLDKKAKEVLATKIVLQTIINDMDKIAAKANIDIERSDILTTKWEEMEDKLDTFIKSLDGYNFKRILSLLACIGVVSYFVFQMGWYRKVPSLLNVISNIPLPSFKPKISEEEVGVTSKIIGGKVTSLLETPITASPLTIITTVGAGVTIYAIAKGTLWVIRKLGK